MHSLIRKKLLQVAYDNPGVQGRVKMAAGIIYKKHLIATGINSYKTHPLMCESNGYRDGQIYLHAEVDAIKNALRIISVDQLSKCDMYIVRLKKTQPYGTTFVLGLAKPCPGCMQLISSFNLKNVYWTEDEETVCFA